MSMAVLASDTPLRPAAGAHRPVAVAFVDAPPIPLRLFVGFRQMIAGRPAAG